MPDTFYPMRKSYEENNDCYSQDNSDFGPRIRRQKSSMSCQDFDSNPRRIQRVKRRLPENRYIQQRSISRDANSLELMGVSPERSNEELPMQTESLPAQQINLTQQPLLQSQSINPCQLDQLTNLLSQLNMKVGDSQLNNLVV